MGIFKTIFGKKKDYGETTVSGGLELLSKLLAPELSKTGMLETYRKSLYVFACISKIATKTASIELQMFKVLNSKGDQKEIYSHPLLDLLYKPNPFQTKAEFFETTVINLKCTGDAFWFKVRNKGGKIIELWNLRPDMMSIITDPVNFIAGYKFAKSDGTEVILRTEDVIHFKYPDPLSMYMGMGPLHPTASRVQTEQYATDFQKNFFLNSARPDAVIKNKESQLTKEQKDDIRDGWGKRNQGVKNSSKIAILDGGLEYQLISISQKEMDYIESLKFTRDDILVALQVPKPLLSIVDDVNRANSETAMQIFLAETIKPEISRLVEKINEEMTYQDFGDEFILGYVDPAPANREQQLKEYSEGITNNYLLINEVREREGLPPLRGGWSFYMPIMNTPMGGLSSQDQKSLFKRVMDNSDDNEEIVNKYKKAIKAVPYNFRGRSMFKMKLEMFEELEKEVKSKLSKKVKKSEKKKEKRSMLTTPESKKAYADLVNKSIDTKSNKLKDSVDTYFIEQKERVLEKIKGEKADKINIKVSNIFDKAKEEKLAVSFITPYMEEFLKDAGIDAMDMIAPQEDFTDTKKTKKILAKRASFFAETINRTTYDALSTTLSEGISAGEGIAELTTRVGELFDGFTVARSELIARTEATAANNEGLLEAFRQSGVTTGKEWINSGDARVRDEHEDMPVGVGGEIVPLDEKFSNGLMYPSEPNCRCVIAPAFLE